jgi:hypothetical protein
MGLSTGEFQFIMASMLILCILGWLFFHFDDDDGYPGEG